MESSAQGLRFKCGCQDLAGVSERDLFKGAPSSSLHPLVVSMCPRDAKNKNSHFLGMV